MLTETQVFFVASLVSKVMAPSSKITFFQGHFITQILQYILPRPDFNVQDGGRQFLDAKQ